MRYLIPLVSNLANLHLPLLFRRYQVVYLRRASELNSDLRIAVRQLGTPTGKGGGPTSVFVGFDALLNLSDLPSFPPLSSTDVNEEVFVR